MIATREMLLLVARVLVAALVLGVYARVAAGALALFTVFVSLVSVRSSATAGRSIAASLGHWWFAALRRTLHPAAN